jgi:hypothetical protein
MASFLFNSCVDDEARGNIDFDSDTFKMLLVTSSYTPDKDAHTKRSNVTNEVTGTGYTSGGNTVTTAVAKDLANDRVTITFNAVSWPNSTISSAGGVIYKARGGVGSADELVGFIDFGGTISSTGGTFSVSQSIITKQN